MEEKNRNKRYIESYEIFHTLGKGMSGKVKKGVAPDGTIVAVKIIYIETMTNRAREHLKREIKALMDLKHPNIMQLRDVYANTTYTKKNGEVKQVVALILEIAGAGELFEFIMHTGSFPEPIARTFFFQLCDAMALCASRGIAHRDLKPENVLLDDNFTLKVADFGLASLTEETINGMCKTRCGTTSYMAPEVLTAKSYYDGNKADSWSAGVILFIMIAGNPPFEQASTADWWFNACRHGRYDRFWAAHLRTSPNFPVLAQDLINQIFVEDPKQRLSFEQIKKHPWLNGPEILDSKKLEAELKGRLGKIQSIKIAKKKREELKKKRMIGDAFAKHVERDASGPEKPPNFDLPTNAMMNVLYSALPHMELLELLCEALELCSDEKYLLGESPIVTQKFEKYKIKAIFAKKEVEIAIRVYSTDSDEELNAIHIARIEGDAFKFNLIRKALFTILLEKNALVLYEANPDEIELDKITDEFDDILDCSATKVNSETKSSEDELDMI
mmetsp:Transcript_14154/g.20920  ORF Transcript_14154/g.20920 Transcript_14154/m.20920 type:complete len:502 (-) Transcript_14154:65-1570(-)